MTLSQQGSGSVCGIEAHRAQVTGKANGGEGPLQAFESRVGVCRDHASIIVSISFIKGGNGTFINRVPSGLNYRV